MNYINFLVFHLYTIFPFINEFWLFINDFLCVTILIFFLMWFSYTNYLNTYPISYKYDYVI